MNERIKSLHEKAVATAKIYRKCEADLICVLQEIDKHRGYLHFKTSSLFEYCTKILGLSEGISYSMISIARKSVQVPALKEAIQKGDLTVSKAHKIASVVTMTNQEQWIDLAKAKTSREIEKAVATANPSASIPEVVRYRMEDRIELKIGISEKLLKKLERVMDLESQRRSKSVSREEALDEALDIYLKKNDPLMKAERSLQKSQLFPGTVESPTSASNMRQRQRKHLPAKISHALQIKYQGQCAYQQSGVRCQNKRWLHVHHIVPVHLGGTDTLDNLICLCATHHRWVHRDKKVRKSEQKVLF